MMKKKKLKLKAGDLVRLETDDTRALAIARERGCVPYRTYKVKEVYFCSNDCSTKRTEDCPGFIYLEGIEKYHRCWSLTHKDQQCHLVLKRSAELDAILGV